LYQLFENMVIFRSRNDIKAYMFLIIELWSPISTFFDGKIEKYVIF